MIFHKETLESKLMDETVKDVQDLFLLGKCVYCKGKHLDKFCPLCFYCNGISGKEAYENKWTEEKCVEVSKLKRIN